MTEADRRCTVGAGFIEWCDEPGIYAARWQNGDTGTLCVRHAAWVRAHSRDLASIASTDHPAPPQGASPEASTDG